MHCHCRRRRRGHRFTAWAWHVIGPHDIYSMLGCRAGIPSACALLGIQSHTQSLYTCVGYIVQFLPRECYAKRGSGVDSSETCCMAM